MVTINFRFLTALAVSTAVAAFAASRASAIITEREVIECFGANGPPICINGQGAGSAFRLAVQAFGNPSDPAVSVAPGGNLFNNFNYVSRSGSSGRRSFLAVRSDGNAVPAPYAFSLSDSALSSADIAAYNSTTPVNIGGSIGVIPRGPAARGFGQPVQLPIVGSSIAVVYDNTGVANGQNLSTQQVCGLFNGTPQPGTPPGLVVAQGVHRSDESGTTETFSAVLRAKCTPLGLWTTRFGTSRGSGLQSVGDADPRCAFEPGVGTRPPNLVCWPDNFADGSQDQGVAAAVRAGIARFGYIEFTEAVRRDNAGLEKALVNGASADPGSGAPTAALTSAQVIFNGQCVLTVDPTTITSGYLFTGVIYLLAYGDYVPSGSDLAIYQGRGDTVRNQVRFLAIGSAVSNSALRSGLQQAGYTPLPNPMGSLGRTVAGQALQCINVRR